MSLNSPILSRHSATVAASFGARAASYELHAEMQRAIAARLAGFLPDVARPRVLELGCGTGLFSRHLVERYPDGSFVLTDAAPAMLSECRRNLAGARAAQIGFEVMDASRPGGQGPYDVIAMSMTLHWLADQAASLDRLRRLLAPVGRPALRGARAGELRRVARSIGRRRVAERTRRHPELCPASSPRSGFLPIRTRSASFAA